MVRSGGGGRAAQERAVEIAQRDNCRLIFLHVVDTVDLLLENESLGDAAREEMTWLGNMTLSLIKKETWSKGVQAETEIRYGSVFNEACAFLREVNACRLLLGSPHQLVGDYNARLEKVHNFARRINQETGITVDVIVGDALVGADWSTEMPDNR
jgi:nucleotide-binding universal stress UspA family protein